MDMCHTHLLHKVRHIRSIAKALGWSLFLLLISVSNIARGASAFVWSQYERPNINVYFSPDGESTFQLTSRGTNVLAMLDRQDDETWICWIDKKAPHGERLYFSRLTTTGKILRKGVVPMTSGGLYSPAIMIEPSGNRVWIAWAENHGRTEDLLVSYLDIGKTPPSDWASPIQITAKDRFSANMPSIDWAVSGQARISWSHTGKDRAQRASTVVSIDLFEASRTSARRIISLKTSYENISSRSPRIKYISDSTEKSKDSLSWKNLTRNKTVLMGAIISDADIVTRIFVRSQ